jgi:hypothetical protein
MSLVKHKMGNTASSPRTYVTHYLSSRPTDKGCEYSFEVDDVVVRKLALVRLLGKGGIGNVYLMNDITTHNKSKSPQQYAVKMVFNIPEGREDYVLTALKTIRLGVNSQLAEVYDAYYFENDSKTERNMYIVMVRE